MTRDSKRRAWSWALSTLLAAVLLYFSLRGVDWRRVWLTIVAAQWSYVALGGAISTGSFFVRALRWRILLNAEAQLGVGTVFWANMAGYLGNNFLPARAGEVVRSVLISKCSGVSKTYVLTTALSERLMDVIALVLGGSLVLIRVEPKPAWMEPLSRTMAVAAGVGALCITILPHTGGFLNAVVRRLPLPETLRNRLLGLTAQILLGLEAFHHWGRFAGCTLLTVVIWMADACAVIAGSHGLGLAISFPVAMLLLTGLGLGSALPSAPGYVGIYQFVAVSVLTPFGISRDSALAYILVAQVSGYVIVLALGLPGLYLLRGGVSK